VRDGYRFLRDFGDIRATPAGLQGGGSDGFLKVETVHDGIVRITYSTSKVETDATSYALDPCFRHDSESWAVSQRAASLRMTTETMLVDIEPEGLIHVSSPSETPLVRDSFGPLRFGRRVGVWKEYDPAATYIGLGEKAGGLKRNGRAYENWNTDHPAYGNTADPLYKSIPFYICVPRDGRPAHGVFVDNSFRSTFDFSARAPGHVGIELDGGTLDYYVLAGPSPADVLRRYTTLTGRAPMPPRWALGYHQSRWSYHPATDVMALAREFRRRDIPLDAIHLDIHYMDGYRVFTWHPERFPDPLTMHSALAEMGVRSVAIVDPGIKANASDGHAAEGLAEKHFVTYPDGSAYQGRVWPGACFFPDFTVAEARRWFGDLSAGMRQAGVSGIWTDMNEPSVFGGKTMPDLVQFAFEGRGGTHAEAHNVYGLQMARAVYEGLERDRPTERPFVITRAGFSGMQRYGASWTGDNVSSWEHLGLAMRMMMSLGTSGVPFTGTDVGGFDGAPEAELYARWIQLGAFSPFFRTHTSRDTPPQEPWSFGPHVEAITRKAIRLRYRLLPYFETVFDQHRSTGLPILRPLILHHPDDVRCHDVEDAFYVGDHLLVAPIIAANHDREVYLPHGRWYPWEGGRSLEGGQVHHIRAPLDTVPIFVRAGSVIPLAEPVASTALQDRTVITLLVLPGRGHSTFYEDDGFSTGYLESGFRRHHFTADDAGQILHRVEGDFESGTTCFRVHYGTEAPNSVTVPWDFTLLEFPD
jgi:alpha-glucosidase